MEIMTTEGCNKFRDGSCVRNCCNTRAEKAYKQGMDSVELQFNPDYLDFQKGVESGREIVVNWIITHSQIEKCDPDTMAYFQDYLWVDCADWKLKLKEWGIER